MKRIEIGFAVLLMATVALAVDPMVYWHLDRVVDSRTIRIRNDQGEQATVILACVGTAGAETKATHFIGERLKDKKLTFYPLNTSETNWMSRPMCLFIHETDPEHHGSIETVYHLPMLNEELIARGYVAFKDVEVPYDQFGLRARLYRANANRK